MKLETWRFKPKRYYVPLTSTLLKGASISSKIVSSNFFTDTVFNVWFLDDLADFEFNRNRAYWFRKISHPRSEKIDDDHLGVNTSALLKYSVLRYSSFIDFFRRRRIDVPVSFVGVRSLRRLNFEYPVLKFSNFLMKSGDREKIFNILSQAFSTIIRQRKQTLLLTNANMLVEWWVIYHFYNLVLTKKNKMHTFNYIKVVQGLHKHFFARRVKKCVSLHKLKKFLVENLIIVHPLFHFYVYNIDKKIKKFTRKKNNKYVFVWKYIPLYKRNLLALKLASKEIKLNSAHTLYKRIIDSVDILKTRPRQSYVWRINQFSHNYVFKNYSKSLMRTLKTTS